VSVVETILVFAVIPVGIYAVISLLTLRDKFARAPRYRPGQAWDHPPVWWEGNPQGTGAGFVAAPPQCSPGGRRTAKGGARGSW
jgi:hypothetical protein